MNKSSIDINDPNAWANIDWSDNEVHPELKKTDAQVNKGRANRLKAKDPEWLNKAREVISDRWADDDYAAAHKTRLAQTKQSEVWKQNHSAAMRELNSSDEYKQLMTKVNRATAQTKEWKRAHRKSADSEYRKQRLREEHSGAKHHAFKGAYIVTNNRSTYNERMGLAPGESIRLMPSDLQKYNANTSHVSKVCNGVMDHYLKCTWRREE